MKNFNLNHVNSLFQSDRFLEDYKEFLGKKNTLMLFYFLIFFRLL